MVIRKFNNDILIKHLNYLRSIDNNILFSKQSKIKYGNIFSKLNDSKLSKFCNFNHMRSKIKFNNLRFSLFKLICLYGKNFNSNNFEINYKNDYCLSNFIIKETLNKLILCIKLENNIKFADKKINFTKISQLDIKGVIIWNNFYKKCAFCYFDPFSKFEIEHLLSNINDVL